MTVPEADRERLVWMYRQMLRIREFEERVKATFTEHPTRTSGRSTIATPSGSSASRPARPARTIPHLAK
jgi:TPP-dependent pyruvate/acetoin dehydrogenase alpha subunit